MEDWRSIKERMLVYEAQRWVGVTENSNNSGQLIELFQRCVDGKAVGEPWCMAFIQYCVYAVDSLFHAVFSQSSSSPLYKSEHCLTVWTNSQSLRINEPHLGCIAIWQHFKNDKPTAMGHAGIVVATPTEHNFLSVEGNTSSDSGIVREGDRVYLKKRSISDRNLSMRLKGFLQIWK